LTTGPTGLYASLKVAPDLLAYGQLLYEKKSKKWSDSMGALYKSRLGIFALKKPWDTRG